MNDPIKNILKNSPQMTSHDTFTFTCNKEIPCFNKCCADINIVLTPYDIIRLKSHLGISSDEFIRRYAVVPFNKEQKIPVVIMKLMDNENKTCHFVSGEGCTVYKDRPWACRMYPVGLASSEANENNESEEFYFLLREDGCKGFGQKREITIKDWISEQGIDEYNEAGKLFKDITLHNYLLEGNDLTPEQMEMFFLVNYNIDKFRRFVFESTFLDKFEVDGSTQEKIKHDDLELLKFGYLWLRFTLFKEQTMTINKELMRKKTEELKKSKAKDK